MWKHLAELPGADACGAIGEAEPASEHLPCAIVLGPGDDRRAINGDVGRLLGRGGNDHVEITGNIGRASLGRGDDFLLLSGTGDVIHGGRGADTLRLDARLSDFDFVAEATDAGGGSLSMIHRLTGSTLDVNGIEAFVFDDGEFTSDTMLDLFGVEAPAPAILVSDGSQGISVNDPNASEVVLWNQAALSAVIALGTVGPTPASRAYAMLATAIFDAWAAYSDAAERVSFDLDRNNAALERAAVSTDANVAKAISYAAHAVLTDLFPSQAAIFDTLLATRLGYELGGDGSVEATLGLDAAADLIGLRRNDGANQANGYADTTGYTPVNPHPREINDITRWTPENVPVDPEDATPEQRFFTPHWREVESFALPEDAADTTVFDEIRPDAPEAFFAEAYSGSILNFDARTITLSAPLDHCGIEYEAGDVIPVSKELIGPVINPGFIAQALEIVELSANLTERDKLQAEFFEDGPNTAFPPGTWMSFAAYISARDDHSLEEDAQMFFMVGNALLDAGIATWEAKTTYDYARPIRAIRSLGELGLIGQEGVDELTGERGNVIEAWGGVDQVTGADLGTRTILAENFVTYQRWHGHPSPPFAEHTSGHSAFSSAAATALHLFTGSDDFGASVVFAPGSAQFVPDLPSERVEFQWPTFTAAAEAAGHSRLYGGIHFRNGNEGSLALGAEVGLLAFEQAQRFIEGTAMDADRPFWGDESLL